MKSKQQLMSKHQEQEIKQETKTKTKSKSKLPLEINLDQIFNPHPELVRTWKESGVQDQYFSFEDNPECNNEKRIFLYANASKPKAEIRHKITSIYRKKEGEKEYCFFNEHLITHDIFHNPLDHTRTLGRYQLPHIVPILGYNPNSTPDVNNPAELGPQAMGAQIESVETVYEWEWEKIKPQLQEWYKKGIINDNTALHVWVGTKKYTVNSWDEFINLRIQDLVLLGRVGFDATGLFDSRDKSTIDSILAIAREKGKEQLVKRLQS
jgi:hypothetical protein